MANAQSRTLQNAEDSTIEETIEANLDLALAIYKAPSIIEPLRKELGIECEVQLLSGKAPHLKLKHTDGNVDAVIVAQQVLDILNKRLDANSKATAKTPDADEISRTINLVRNSEKIAIFFQDPVTGENIRSEKYGRIPKESSLAEFKKSGISVNKTDAGIKISLNANKWDLSRLSENQHKKILYRIRDIMGITVAGLVTGPAEIDGQINDTIPKELHSHLRFARSSQEITLAFRDATTKSEQQQSIRGIPLKPEQENTLGLLGIEIEKGQKNKIALALRVEYERDKGLDDTDRSALLQAAQNTYKRITQNPEMSASEVLRTLKDALPEQVKKSQTFKSVEQTTTSAIKSGSVKKHARAPGPSNDHLSGTVFIRPDQSTPQLQTDKEIGGAFLDALAARFSVTFVPKDGPGRDGATIYTVSRENENGSIRRAIETLKHFLDYELEQSDEALAHHLSPLRPFRDKYQKEICVERKTQKQLPKNIIDHLKKTAGVEISVQPDGYYAFSYSDNALAQARHVLEHAQKIGEVRQKFHDNQALAHKAVVNYDTIQHSQEYLSSLESRLRERITRAEQSLQENGEKLQTLEKETTANQTDQDIDEDKARDKDRLNNDIQRQRDRLESFKSALEEIMDIKSGLPDMSDEAHKLAKDLADTAERYRQKYSQVFEGSTIDPENNSKQAELLQSLEKDLPDLERKDERVEYLKYEAQSLKKQAGLALDRYKVDITGLNKTGQKARKAPPSPVLVRKLELKRLIEFAQKQFPVPENEVTKAPGDADSDRKNKTEKRTSQRNSDRAENAAAARERTLEKLKKGRNPKILITDEYHKLGALMSDPEYRHVMYAIAESNIKIAVESHYDRPSETYGIKTFPPADTTDSSLLKRAILDETLKELIEICNAGQEQALTYDKVKDIISSHYHAYRQGKETYIGFQYAPLSHDHFKGDKLKLLDNFTQKLGLVLKPATENGLKGFSVYLKSSNALGFEQAEKVKDLTSVQRLGYAFSIIEDRIDLKRGVSKLDGDYIRSILNDPQEAMRRHYGGTQSLEDNRRKSAAGTNKNTPKVHRKFDPDLVTKEQVLLPKRDPKIDEAFGRPHYDINDIVPISEDQARALTAFENNSFTILSGAASMGKTRLGVAYGVYLLMNGVVDKMVICRPALEAGENLGFLPGGIKEKTDPYLQPIYDEFKEVLAGESGDLKAGKDLLKELQNIGAVEIVPLAFMRGRTLKKTYAYVDEAQNMTWTQVKMAMTRIGLQSHLVMGGDPTQSDLPKGVPSGLLIAANAFEMHKRRDVTVVRGTQSSGRHEALPGIIDVANQVDKNIGAYAEDAFISRGDQNEEAKDTEPGKKPNGKANGHDRTVSASRGVDEEAERRKGAAFAEGVMEVFNRGGLDLSALLGQTSQQSSVEEQTDPAPGRQKKAPNGKAAPNREGGPGS